MGGDTRDEIHRALDLADEFGTTAVIVGGREAAKVADRLKAAKVPVVLRLDFPEEPKVPTEQAYRKKAAAERDEPLRVLADRKAKWKEQVATAAALAKAGVPFAFATEGIDRLDTVPGRTSASSSLPGSSRGRCPGRHSPPTPPPIAGVDKRLGTLEAGKLGHVIVMTAPFTEERAKVKYVLIDGLKFEIKPEDAARAKATGGRSRPGRRRRTGRGRREVAAEEDQPDDDDSPGSGRRRSRQPSRPEDASERAPRPTDDKSPGTRPRLARRRPRAKRSTARPRNRRRSAVAKPQEATSRRPMRRDEEASRCNRRQAEAPKPAAAPFVDVATELDEDRKPAIHTGGNVFIKDATILTVTKGTIAKGSILVEEGKIKAVGTGLTAPAGVTVIDAAGLVAMPGIIDTHSHIAVQGGVNEGTLSVVPEVRVKDVVTGDEIAIYRRWPAERPRPGCSTARPTRSAARTPWSSCATASRAAT